MSAAQQGAWTHQVTGCLDDPTTCIIGYCLPCVLHGMTAEKVHGGEFINHCLKFYLYSCVCACGLVSGPVRYEVRQKFDLPQEPTALSTMDDCLINTIPCVNCLALCQTAQEVNSRNITSPINAVDFDWAPNLPYKAPATQEMAKE